MSNMQIKLDYADSIANWFLEIGEACILRGNFEEGVNYTYIAATIFSRQNRILTSERLEANLRFLAERINEYNAPPPSTPFLVPQNKGCLHVLDEALPAGGLTAMAIRWIKSDQKERSHNVVLLSQNAPTPEELSKASQETGGTIYKFDPNAPFLDRAVWLKKLAHDAASTVILHISVFDVICGVAFGTQGGPPVLMVNHAAHIFWSGASIADLVVNCRGSALERLWTETYRGSKSTIIPIPLPESSLSLLNESETYDQKHLIKKNLDLPVDSILILTVGASFKYLPIDDLDFVEICESILNQFPNVYLLAVGVLPDDRWNSASKRLGFRIRAMRALSQTLLSQIRKASDIYIESFPFGSTTSLLEAGLNGISVVLAPSQCPPPYGTDGVAIDNTLNRPKTVEEFKNEIIRLIKNPSQRAQQGEKIRNAVANHHTGSGWRKYLQDAIINLPQEHIVNSSISPVRTPKATHEYWSTFVTKHTYGYEETLEHAVTRALLMGVWPHLTEAAQQACKNYKSVRVNRTIPLPLLIFLCNFLLPVLPRKWAVNIFRSISFLCRGLLISRLYKKSINIIQRKRDLPSWYEEYKNVQDR